MAFFQDAPALGNQYDEDLALRSWLRRHLPADALAEMEPSLRRMGERAGGESFRQALAERDDEPVLVQWDAWGRRVDHIELTPHWKRMQRIAAEEGLVATAYERKHGEHSRVHQMALVHLFEPSSHVYSCPLAMTDGAARTLSAAVAARGEHRELAERALGHLLSRDPEAMWTSGQWMTERTGGSDVAICETVAKKGDDGRWRLHGTKWFSSATTSEMALTLGRPEGNPPGGSGLALFFVEVRDAEGRLNGIQVNRLKDKLGTRMVPTAELTLDGAVATPVAGLEGGIKAITPMLAITRTWNTVCAVSAMRRGLALARDYAARRVAFGAPLAQKPLHVDTLAAMEAEYRGGLALSMRLAHLLGREEAGTISELEAQLLRLLTPIGKLVTGKQAVAVCSEALEAFGGAGYVEDTGLPRLLRDAQVLPIWEGTTNVLSLDLLRALARAPTLEPIEHEVARALQGAPGELRGPAEAAVAGVRHATAWLLESQAKGLPALEEGARRFALTLGRSLELAWLVEEGTHGLAEGDGRWAAAARRFARHGVDQVQDGELASDARLLAD